MLGGSARRVLSEMGADYALEAVRPILRRAPIVLGNLEGPLAAHARREQRTFAYRVSPKVAPALLRAGINVVTLANNHLLDCGRDGALETMEVLRQAGIAWVGAAADEQGAHQPCIMNVGGLRIGMLGYCWNDRTAATSTQAGCAMDTAEKLESDIRSLRTAADRVVATFHWGDPYQREAAPEVRARARLAIDCGADAVVGHHPHVVQPFEIYRGRVIFYSVGNFAFGSGNSQAESLLLAIRFDRRRMSVRVHPVYVKNCDPRVDYQPKLMRGALARRLLRRLAEASGPSGALLHIRDDDGLIDLHWQRKDAPCPRSSLSK
jgi:poly-gamma-glutamate capsule biosynthesis protein CapA/YwtB (metallophosphatase superfamily)